VSKVLSETGEAKTLAWGTINIGQVSGGPSMNLAPAAARAGIDIHFPVETSPPQKLKCSWKLPCPEWRA